MIRFGLAAALALLALAPHAFGQAPLTLTVVDSQAGIVDVRDRSGQPAVGAVVVFTIDTDAARFAGGLRSSAATTDSTGRASMPPLRMDRAGAVRVAVTATYQGQATSMNLTRTIGSNESVPTTPVPGVTPTGIRSKVTSVVAAIASIGAATGALVTTLAGAGAPATVSNLVVPSASEITGPPTIAGLVVSPATLGLQGGTEFSFLPQGATDPGGGPLSYVYDFGDGTTAATSPFFNPENFVIHVYDVPGNFGARVTVVNRRGATATATANVTVRGVTGRWVGTWTRFNGIINPAPRPPSDLVVGLTLDAVQNGATVTATVTERAVNVAFLAGFPHTCTLSGGSTFYVGSGPPTATFGTRSTCTGSVTTSIVSHFFGQFDESLNRLEAFRTDGILVLTRQ